MCLRLSQEGTGAALRVECAQSCRYEALIWHAEGRCEEKKEDKQAEEEGEEEVEGGWRDMKVKRRKGMKVRKRETKRRKKERQYIRLMNIKCEYKQRNREDNEQIKINK